MNTETIIEVCSSKYKRADLVFQKYLQQNRFLNGIKIELKDIPFSVFRGILYSFFQNQGILVSVRPYNFENRQWLYEIYLDGQLLKVSNFKERESAEWSAFERCFQYHDTKLFIEDIKSRFHESIDDTSCCTVHWEHLFKVLKMKRLKKNI